MSNRYVEQDEVGGVENLHLRTEPIPVPGEGEIVVRNRAIGFNFDDTSNLMGAKSVNLPLRAGCEGAGEVHAVGPNVKGFEVGDRVVYRSPRTKGAFADYKAARAEATAKLPDEISYDLAAASFVKGLIAQYLIEQTYAPKRDDIVLFHAASGGVGSIFLQWAKSHGVKVIATVSTDEKAEVARADGAWQVLKYTDDIPARVKELTFGKKAKVVYDSVGKDTYEASLDSLAPSGRFVSFGEASGETSSVDLLTLFRKGSITFTRVALFSRVENIQKEADAFFKKLLDGTVKVRISGTYNLSEIRDVYQNSIDRKSIGSVIIHP